MICPTCGGAMLTERPHRHYMTDRTPTTEASKFDSVAARVLLLEADIRWPDDYTRLASGVVEELILAIEARASLDVDRLARAIRNGLHLTDFDDPNPSEAAERIAREYAALEEPTP